MVVRVSAPRILNREQDGTRAPTTVFFSVLYSGVNRHLVGSTARILFSSGANCGKTLPSKLPELLLVQRVITNLHLRRYFLLRHVASVPTCCFCC